MRNEADEFLFRFRRCLDPAPDDLCMESTLADMENLDSLAWIGTIAMIDAEYAVILKRAALRSCKTVRDLFALVQAKRNA